MQLFLVMLVVGASSELLYVALCDLGRSASAGLLRSQARELELSAEVAARATPLRDDATASGTGTLPTGRWSWSSRPAGPGVLILLCRGESPDGAIATAELRLTRKSSDWEVTARSE